MKAPRVSVNINVFNNERFLPAALLSLEKQTFRDFEALMVDGGSQDRSPEIARAWVDRDSRFRWIATDQFRPVGEARSIALGESRGEYVAILDADDLTHPRRMERQIGWLDSRPTTVLCGTDYRVINARGWILRFFPNPVRHDVEIRWRVAFGNCLAHSSTMFRRQAALHAGGYDSRLAKGEDMEFYSRMLGEGLVDVLPEVLNSWRFHGQSLSSREPAAQKRDYAAIVQEAIWRLLEQRASEPVAAALYNQSMSPADNSAVFLDGLSLTQRAAGLFLKRHVRESADPVRLHRSVFFQLLHLRVKNRREPWWGDVEGPWMRTMRALSETSDYRWYLDRGLLLFYRQLLKCDLAGFMARRPF